MENIFTIDNEIIRSLNQTSSVQFFRNLLFAEARSIGIPINKVLISLSTNVADGGVDAKVEPEVQVSNKSGLITSGLSCYQIKSGDTFKPTQAAMLKKELFGIKTIHKDNLGVAVKNCMDNKGRYVLVCFGQEFTDVQKEDVESQIIKLFEQCGYNNPLVEVWGQSHIIGFTQVYPSLVLQLKNYEDLNFCTHRVWSNHGNMKHKFKEGELQKAFIDDFQTELRRSDEAVHIRICGEPGSGKTKLVLEATKSDDLAPLVIYCDSGSKFKDSHLMNEIMKEDNLFSAILVVDECTSEDKAFIWDRLQGLGPRIKLVTIHHEIDDSRGTMRYKEMPLLEKSKIVNIIEDYGLQTDQADRWANFCDGSPRVAHVIGWNLKKNPEDILKPLDTVPIWDRYVIAGDKPSDVHVKQRQMVLRYLALFKKFGFRKVVKHESDTIAAMVNAADPQITKQKFSEIIKDLEGRKILQGENTLYITPKALHIQLWKEWWEVYGESFELEEFIKNLPDSLKEWFYEMFKYAAESTAATKVVDSLLSPEGPFQKDDYLKTALGADFFLALTEANPAAALNCLKKTLNTWTSEELYELKIPRRSLVWSVERIAIREELFKDAAKLLLKLAEAENENYSNNATGTFIGLFSLGPGELAPTGASPIIRLQILETAIASSSEKQRNLALRAFKAALQTTNFHRVVGPEYRGLHKENLWTPESREEHVSAYKSVWRLLYSKLEILNDEEKIFAIKALLDNLRGLVRIPELGEEILSDLKQIVAKNYIDSREILHVLSIIFHYDGKKIPPNMIEELKKLEKSLIGEDFHSLVKRYVGMELVEDKYDENGKRVDKAEKPINDLVDMALKDKNYLVSELDWLISEDAKNGFYFGYKLGIKDKNFEILDLLIGKYKNSYEDENVRDYLLGGYFRALNENNPEKWELTMDNLANEETLLEWVPSLTWRSGNLNDKSANRILKLAKEGKIEPYHFRMFGLGSVIENLTENIFQEWIKYLLNCKEIYAISIALDLYHFFYIRKESKYKLPKELSLEILMHPALFKKPDNGTREQMDDYHWKEISLMFIKLYPNNTLELGYKILECFGEEGTIVEMYSSDFKEVIYEIAKLYPDEIWDKVSKYLGPPIDVRSYSLKTWLRGSGLFETEPGTLSVFKPEKIWRWVDEAPERRAWYLATFVPKVLFRKEGEFCWVREILIRYGQMESVRNNLNANFYSEGWTGPASLHYQSRLDFFEEFRKEETNENVLKWLDEMIEDLKKDIEREKISEERRGF